MPKYAVLWKFADGAIQAMVGAGHPSPATARSVVESLGGNLESYYWIAGSPHDGIAIVEVPDASTVAALKLAFRNALVVEYIEAFELIAVEDIQRLLDMVPRIDFPS